MSENNLIKARFALDLRDLRLSIDARESIDFDNTSIADNGLIDVSEFSVLNRFSSQLQDQMDEETQHQFSSGNLNLYALNDRIRLRLIEIFSDILEVDIFNYIRDAWLEEDKEGFELVCGLFSDIFYTFNGKPKIEELLRFWFNLNNPAHTSYHEFLYETDVELNTITEVMNATMDKITNHLPEIEEGNIIEFLTTPEQLYPNSVKKQIKFILSNWKKYLTKENIKFLLLAMDLIKEEEKFRGFGGAGPTDIYEFDGAGGKASFYKTSQGKEKFSEDKDWMPQTVLLAKNVYVWLDQLSKKYNKKIAILSDIPDEELDQLAQRGFTGLWLVGIWERSEGSKKIKQLTGNPDAIASAYSIDDYVIAENLGGKQAFDDLTKRLQRRDIKIGADMVPNHMGITSKWLKDHPDWFIQTDEKPFSNYSYTNRDISDDENLEIYLEDHYYDQSDAAVTFKWVNSTNGQVRYIYHGNDGTSLPWNDTAQIDFLNDEVREKLINTIVDVAKKFNIIRFDAAMVLAKQHIRRLWYPAPGEGGDIPSRSRFSLSDEEFNEAIPNEFWREVVDRVNEEVPDTLLLAEAFWLLEGYFVRTLGMHRVYNSAFMKMLRNEENSKYRQTIKNVLEYDPEILKRFVNYLTTPDEEPAISNFGDGEKYFGIVTMMATMPGLPMFGHGQFEGLTEKYGMEYNRAKYEETVNKDLVARHEREIVPLLKKRYLFAGSKNFYLYDFFTDSGKVNENVFTYSNRHNGEKALIIYNNHNNAAHGWIKRSVAYSEKLDNKMNRMRQVDLFEGLDLADNDGFLLFRDHVSGLEYIRSKDEIREKGLFAHIGPYKHQVFLDLTEVTDNLEIWEQIESELDGQGTLNIQELFNEHSLHGIKQRSIDERADEIKINENDSISGLKIEIAELREENESLKGQITAMEADLDKYTSTQQDNFVSRVEGKSPDNESKKNTVIQDTLLEKQNRNPNLKREINELRNILKNKPSQEDFEALKRKNKEQQDKLQNYKSKRDKLAKNLQSLEADNTGLKQMMKQKEQQLVSLKEKMISITEKSDLLENKLEQQTNKINELEQENAALRGENKELRDQLDQEGYVANQDTLLSSVLLETIANRLESTNAGIKLRNLAMSMGISTSVCLDHVRTMEEKGEVSIKYSSDDDSNPLILSTKNASQ